MLRVFNKIKQNIKPGKRHFQVKASSHNDFVPKELSSLLSDLHGVNHNIHKECMELRKKNHKENSFCYREDTQKIREGDWKAEEIPDKLKKRHVELTGPGNDPKMVINAMNSNANCYMLDIEDSMSPSWDNVVNAHKNIKLVSRGELKYETPKKLYEVTNSTPPTFLVRARGLHMMEENVRNKDGTPIQATLFDIGTHLYNNGKHMNETD